MTVLFPPHSVRPFAATSIFAASLLAGLATQHPGATADAAPVARRGVLVAGDAIVHAPNSGSVVNINVISESKASSVRFGNPIG